jgi:hypothetical protein
MKKIINCETGEVTERPFTAEELAQMEIDNANAQALRKKIEAELAAKDQAKTQLLAQLGITEEQAKLLFS